MLILTIIAMKLYSEGRLADWGFNLDISKVDTKIVGWFLRPLSKKESGNLCRINLQLILDFTDICRVQSEIAGE